MSGAATPGPWTVDIHDDRLARRVYVAAGSSPLSPTICALHGEGDEREANARLIAAAPDLYAALSNLIVLLDTNPTAELAELMLVWRVGADGEQAARAALAKADTTEGQ